MEPAEAIPFFRQARERENGKWRVQHKATTGKHIPNTILLAKENGFGEKGTNRRLALVTSSDELYRAAVFVSS